MHYFELEVVLTKRDPNALVREYRHIENVPTLAVASSTADALISRLAVFGEFRRQSSFDGGDIVNFIYRDEEDGRIVGFANIIEYIN